MVGFGAVEEVLYQLAITLEQFEVDYTFLVKVRPELNIDGRVKELLEGTELSRMTGDL